MTTNTDETQEVAVDDNVVDDGDNTLRGPIGYSEDFSEVEGSDETADDDTEDSEGEEDSVD